MIELFEKKTVFIDYDGVIIDSMYEKLFTEFQCIFYQIKTQNYST